LVKTLYEQAHPRKGGAVKQEEELPPGFSDVELAVVHAERGFAAFPSPSAAATKDENMDAVDADSKTAECSGMLLEAHDLRGLKVCAAVTFQRVPLEKTTNTMMVTCTKAACISYVSQYVSNFQLRFRLVNRVYRSMNSLRYINSRSSLCPLFAIS
jgi:hypothetical protein